MLFQFTPGWATFGLALPQGAAIGPVSVSTFPTQTDIKTRWPNGSTRFAVVTARILTAGALPITPIIASSGETFVPTWPSVTVACGSYVATLPILPAFIAANPWLSGPLVRESRVVVAAGAHPTLQVVFDVRSYVDGSHRVDIAVQNGRDIAGLNAVDYAVTITIDGVTRVTKAVRHWAGTRYRLTFGANGFVESTITPDIETYIAAGAVPRYHQNVGAPALTAAGPAYDILGNGPMLLYMGQGGGRPEIAFYPEWQIPRGSISPRFNDLGPPNTPTAVQKKVAS